ncbi:MAG: hypothetical protein ACQXXF_03125 [Thermoplasmatota archaeon]|jgi:hypothetical protein
MNKTLIILGIGIWGVMRVLNFILRGSLISKLSGDEIATVLLPLTIIEIFAFILAVIGLIKND